MRVITFPNGQVLTSSALSTNDIQLVFQMAIAQMLGLGIGMVMSGTTTASSTMLTVASTAGVIAGQPVIGIGIPRGTTVQGVTDTVITMSAPAAASQTSPVAINASSGVFSSVRVGYLTEGQPGFLRDADTAIIIARTLDDSYNLIRDVLRAPTDDIFLAETSTYTRVWQLSFTFYGPNSGDNARLVKSCLYLDWVHDLLAQSNLYFIVNPPDPVRAPELIEAQWWERSDLIVRYNEFITETIQQQSVASADIVIETANEVVEVTVPD